LEFLSQLIITIGKVSRGLKFETLKKAPPLAIPEGKGVTKYDYTKAKTEPFSFPPDQRIVIVVLPNSFRK
jgi:hypothetical protein